MVSKLTTFQLFCEDGTQSPVLTSTREYGRWFETVFDPSICRTELYKTGWDRSGKPVLENHPGSKIGQWFDRRTFSNKVLLSWFIHQDSSIMRALCDYGIAEQRDAIPISVSDKEGRKLLRCYSTEQILLYVRSNIDRGFSLLPHCTTPKRIKVSSSELDKIIIPEIKQEKGKLF